MTAPIGASAAVLAPIRRATATDHATLVEILVEAFADDPFFRSLWPDRSVYDRRAPAWFDLDLRQLEARADLWVAADGTGMACAIALGVDVAGPGEYDELAALLDAGSSVPARRAMALLAAADDASPGDPHWTCVYVAVRPAAQGRGLGQRLLAPVIAAADHDRVPIQLASTNPRNLSFYGRLGFRIHATLRPEPALPPIWIMWRDVSA